jgi:hypothetical protein
VRCSTLAAKKWLRQVGKQNIRRGKGQGAQEGGCRLLPSIMFTKLGKEWCDSQMNGNDWNGVSLETIKTLRNNRGSGWNLELCLFMKRAEELISNGQKIPSSSTSYNILSSVLL